MIGVPRLHLRTADSTNDRAKALAAGGAPHGTLVTAAEQTAGRGRQGRRWSAPAGRALLMSVVLRDPPAPLPLLASVAVADVAGAGAAIKWPNDVLAGDGRKVAGILVEGRPADGWAVLGIGVNVAVRPGDLPVELRAGAGSLGLEPRDVEPVLARLLAALGARLADPVATLAAWRERDALRGREVRWAAGAGVAAGIDADGRLLVDPAGGERVALEAGEVHLLRGPAA